MDPCWASVIFSKNFSIKFQVWIKWIYRHVLELELWKYDRNKSQQDLDFFKFDKLFYYTFLTQKEPFHLRRKKTEKCYYCIYGWWHICSNGIFCENLFNENKWNGYEKSTIFHSFRNCGETFKEMPVGSTELSSQKQLLETCFYCVYLVWKIICSE